MYHAVKCIPCSNFPFCYGFRLWTYITAIVIAFFRKEFAQQEAEWIMIEEKALQWLKTKDLEGKDVIREASDFLSA